MKNYQLSGWQNKLIKIILTNDFFVSTFFFSNKFLKELSVSLMTYAFLKSQWWSREDMESFQMQKICKLLSLAKTNVPFWQNRLRDFMWIEKGKITLELFNEIPILQRNDLRMVSADIDHYINKDYKEDVKNNQNNIHRGKTSGSTSEPLVYFQNNVYEINSLAIFRRFLVTIHKNKILPLLQVRQHDRRGVADKNIYKFFVLNCNQIKYKVDQLNLFSSGYPGEFILYSFASYILEITSLVKKNILKIKPYAIISSGEALTHKQKEDIGEYLSVPIFNCYTSLEIGWMANDCEYHNLHINEDYVYIQVVNNDGKCLGYGERGRIIVTAFNNTVMPFIRYDNGDVGILHNEPCTCGRTSRYLTLEGREAFVLHLPNNRKVPYIELIPILQEYSTVFKYHQVVQNTRNDITINFVPESNQEVAEADLLEIARRLRLLTDDTMHISFNKVDTIESTPTGKQRVFKSFITN